VDEQIYKELPDFVVATVDKFALMAWRGPWHGRMVPGYWGFLVAAAVQLTSGLSFLGIGVPPPTPEWGAILAGGRNYLNIAPHITLAPGIVLLAVLLALNLLGDTLRDALDPRTRV
jgi:ABC-type dipeptide/oligopeptide/nickel transport system permease subunit